MNNLSIDPQELWSKALDKLRVEIGDENTELWLKPVEVLRLENQVIHVKVPNRFFSEGIKDRYQKSLTNIFKEITGIEIGIDFLISKDLKNDRE